MYYLECLPQKRNLQSHFLKEMLGGASNLTARLVLATNSDTDIKFKFRYVIGGHRDKLEQSEQVRQLVSVCSE